MTPGQIDQSIYELAIKNGFTDTSARFVVAQARLESADKNGNDYSSNVFKLNNNMFGMKFISQPLATKGSKAPSSEGDFYAKYIQPADSAADVITRLYAIKRNGVTSNDLKNAKTPEEYANLLKKRGYFGASASDYAKGIKAKLKKIQIIPIETLPGVTIDASKKKFKWWWLVLLAGGVYLFVRKRKKK